VGDGKSILTWYYEAVDLQTYLSGKSGNGLHTLFVDYYIYYDSAPSGTIVKGGCGSDNSRASLAALGVTFGHPPTNFSAACNVTLKDLNGKNALPFRTLQHEWSHSYGIDFDPYTFSLNNPSRCQTDCIMLGDYMDDSIPRTNVWCDRCKEIVKESRTKWN
jgi:hypothetical protein